MVRAAVGMNSDQQGCALLSALVSVGHGPGTLVSLAAIVVSFGRYRIGDVDGTKDRNSGPAVISGLFRSRAAPRSRCSQS